MLNEMVVQIVNYKSSWNEDYNVLNKILTSALVDNSVEIEHIGSTAIPQMPAKAIIDVQIGIAKLDEFVNIKKKLVKLGFKHIEGIKQDHVPFKDFDYFEEGYEKRFLKGCIKGISCNLHIRELNSKNWMFAINFRDFLRSNAQAAIAYAQIKKRLSDARVVVHDYCLIKDPVCDLLFLLFTKFTA